MIPLNNPGEGERAEARWTLPYAPAAKPADELEEVLRSLALAVRTIRDVAGPTHGVTELAGMVTTLLRQVQALTPEERGQAAKYLRQGMALPSAVVLSSLDVDVEDQ